MLADFLTIMEKKIIPNNGQVKWEDLKLAYLGDLKNNVTYDLMRTCSILGIEMRVSGPNSKEFAIEESVWDEVDKRLVKYYENPQDAVRDVDIVYTDSWMSYGIGHDEESYRRSSLIQYRVTTGLLTHAKKDVIFMNCLPADRTAEQEADVIDNPQVSVVYDEAENRLHAQKALLLYLLAYDKYFATRDMNCVVVALGGNALSVGDDNSYKAQIQKCKETCNMLVRINLKTHATLCISHGNGPQVGTIYQQNQDAEESSRMPLSVCGAQSQGMIGYMIAQELHNACCGHDQLKHEVRGISTIVTQTIVDEHDKAFKKPNKPIGSHLSESEMEQEKQKDNNKQFHEDSSEKGKYRLIVPSPEPIGFLESKTIQDLVGSGHWVICGGGGGVPVVKDSQGRIKGVDGVVDKDKTAAKLGELVHADMLLILTVS
jgi:carbamate kinase